VRGVLSLRSLYPRVSTIVTNTCKWDKRVDWRGVICARASSCHLPLGFARSLASLGVPAPRLSLQSPAARCDAQTIVNENLCEGGKKLVGRDLAWGKLLKTTEILGEQYIALPTLFSLSFHVSSTVEALLDHAKIRILRSQSNGSSRSQPRISE
jgi:hypothetical protein